MHPTYRLMGRRIQLTTKDVKGGFYKGNRTGSMGTHTKYGTYHIDWKKVRTYIVPDLEGFTLTPFVTKKMEKNVGGFKGVPKGPYDGQVYLDKWKRENGET